jgi:hypothetical protein
MSMKTLKLLNLFILMLATYAASHAQSAPDSVCAGAVATSYTVAGTAGSTYQWFVSGGTQASGGNTDSITINWSATPGIDTLKVLEFNTIGCPGDTIRLAVVRLAPPTVVLSGTDSICINSATVASRLTMTFTGLGPWVVGYTEDGAARTVTTTSNPYTFNSHVYTTSGVKNYAISTIEGRLGCTGTQSGAAAVTVFPKPSTSAIRRH